jgi:hypothetical protein
MGIRPPNSRYVGSHGYGNVWNVVPRCNYDQVQNHNCEHYSILVRTVMFHNDVLMFVPFKRRQDINKEEMSTYINEDCH